MAAITKAFTAIADGAVDPDSPVDTALVTAIRDNATHLREWLGAAYYAGAVQDHDHDGLNSKSVVLADGVVVEAKLGASAVAQGKLKTATGIVSTNVNTNLTLPGGTYGFYPQVRETLAVATTVRALMLVGNESFGSTYVTNIYLEPNAAGGDLGLLLAQQRYVTASWPYECYRDGDQIPIHVFALVRKSTRAVVATYTAEDPPHAHNGPTVLNPEGRLRQLARVRLPLRLLGKDITPAEQAARDEALAAFYDYMRDPANAKEIAECMHRKFTQAEKNADMHLIPHPFGNVDTSLYQVVAVNPTDDRVCRALAARHLWLGDSVGEMLHDGHLQLDNDPMPGLATPSGVIAVRARPRLTR